MSSTQFGLALGAPSTQTILPVMGYPSAQVYGYLMISKTTFQGTETTFTMPQGTVPVQSVTLPSYGVFKTPVHANIGLSLTPAIEQYMAVTYSDQTLVTAKRPPAAQNPLYPSTPAWVGFDNFISASDSGFAQQFIHASSTYTERLTLGNLIESLVFGLDTTTSNPDPSQPPNAGSPNLTMTWTANIQESALVGECPFFDFNWVTLFQAKQQTYNGTNLAIPMSITVTTVPAGFKCYLVNQPTVVTGTNVTYDTLRVMATGGSSITAGTYTFDYTITTDQGSVAASLALTVTPA